MNTPDTPSSLSGSSWWGAAASAQTQDPPDEHTCRREHHRLRDLAQPWIRRISEHWPVPHTAVTDFNLATDRFSRLDDPARLPGALEQVRLACEALARIVEAPSDTAADAAAMPPPPTTFFERWNRSRLVKSGLELAARSISPAAFELLVMRLPMLEWLDDCAAQVTLAGETEPQPRRRAEWAMDHIELILQAYRDLIALPEAPLAALAAEEGRVARHLKALALEARVNGSSQGFIRLVGVHTACTVPQHAEALSAYEAVIDELAGGAPATPGDVRHKPPPFRAPPNRNP